MAKKTSRRKSHRRTRRSGGRSALTSDAACNKVMDKCGMSKSYCDDSRFKQLMKEARSNYSAEIKGLKEGLAAAKQNRAIALKSCRKNIRAQQQQESIARHMRESISRINGFKRRVRR